MDSNLTFGQWLKRQRQGLGFTQQALAMEVGCSVVTIRKLESDERQPSWQLADRLGECLKVPEAERPAFIAFARSEPAAEPLSVSLVGQLPWHEDHPPAPPRRHNLPLQATAFVGRTIELGEIGDRLNNPDCRLLTLVGPGGIGKTRLALEAASASLDQFEDGVYFVPLAAITTSDHLLTAIANAIAYTFSGKKGAREQLLRFLRRQEMLLLLDNFEQLLEPEGRTARAVTLLGEILAEAPGIKLLVTSRERLMLQGEWLYEVRGMRYPDAAASLSTVDISVWLGAYSAIQFFVACAHRVRPDFNLDRTTLPDVLSICRLVGGMPLALELAATWLPALSIAEIATEIEQSLDLLTTRQRDVPERHRSLRTVFDYSWQRLTTAEQAVLMRLSVFQGGFSREAASDVAGASLASLASLVDKSLVKRSAGGRYEMHELLRQFCLEKLRQESGAETATRRRHCLTFAAFMQAQEAGWKGKREAEALAAIESDIDNIRAGWRWAVSHREDEAIEKYLESLAHFYGIRGWYEEGKRAFMLAANALADGKSDAERLLLAKVWVRLATMHQYLSQLEKAQQRLEASLAIAQRLESGPDIARAITTLGDVAIFRGRPDKAAGYFQQALDMYEALDDEYGKVYTLQGLGWAALTRHEIDLAQQVHGRNLVMLRKRGPKSLLAWTLFEMGDVAAGQGNYEEAQQYLEESRKVCEAINYRFALLSALAGLGEVACARGRYDEAKGHFQAGLALRAHLGDIHNFAYFLMMLTYVALEQDALHEAEKHLLALVQFAEGIDYDDVPLGCYHYARGEFMLHHHQLSAAETHFRQSIAILRPTRRSTMALLSVDGLARTLCALGNYAQAQRYFVEALREAVKISWAGAALDATIGLAELFACQGKSERAVELAAFTTGQSASTAKARQRAERLLAKLKSRAPADLLESARVRGRKLSLKTLSDELVATGGFNG